MDNDNKKNKYVTYVNSNGFKVCIKRSSIITLFQSEKPITTAEHGSTRIYYQITIKVKQGNTFLETFETLLACNELFSAITKQLN